VAAEPAAERRHYAADEARLSIRVGAAVVAGQERLELFLHSPPAHLAVQGPRFVQAAVVDLGPATYRVGSGARRSTGLEGAAGVGTVVGEVDDPRPIRGRAVHRRQQGGELVQVYVTAGG
jgi:hypothetical protein